uniref:mitogen-activated protein kinase kinase n=1 Tax=Calidris pygmaea TaxID=425635 RepID=A0A8C3KY84_9CHAR
MAPPPLPPPTTWRRLPPHGTASAPSSHNMAPPPSPPPFLSPSPPLGPSVLVPGQRVLPAVGAGRRRPGCARQPPRPAAACEPGGAGMLWLLCGPSRAMETQALVIRIKIPDGGAVDWTVHSAPQLLFRDVLDVIGQVLPDATTTAFEYEDEDGDRITVRSDEEMKAMLSYVNTRAGSANNSSSAVSDSLPSNSLKKSSAELKKILANGQMNEQDIRYRDILGHGNGGTVYKAYHVPSGKILAVKVIPLDITLELQKQIMSELEILYKCDSSYIIGFYGAFFVENRISLCTEFMDGGSLDVYRKIPEHVLGRIAVAVVKGLTYLWSLKILHRDVKPSNMLVNTRGQVKLCDFGVSTQLVNSIAKTYVGTNAYMAPERISGEQYGIHSDVWSLGISFMELALGRFPYPQIQKNQGSLMPLQLLQCIVDEESPVLPAGEFSEPFVHFITQCMKKQPKERPAPEDLMGHPFIVQYNDGNAEVVSMWVCRMLEERRSAQGPQ